MILKFNEGCGAHLVMLLGICFRPIGCSLGQVYLTNRFHVAVHLSSDGSQMMSKCGKKKKVAHEPLGEFILDVHTILDVFCDLSLDRHIWQHGIHLVYAVKIAADLGEECRGCVSPLPEITCGF